MLFKDTGSRNVRYSFHATQRLTDTARLNSHLKFRYTYTLCTEGLMQGSDPSLSRSIS
jgi:hypothetical protein